MKKQFIFLSIIASLLLTNIPVYAFTAEKYTYDEDSDIMPLLYTGDSDNAYTVATYILLPENMVTTDGYTVYNEQAYAIKNLSSEFILTFQGKDDTITDPICFEFRKYLAASDYITQVGSGYLFRQEYLIEPGTYIFSDNMTVSLPQGYYAITPDYKNPFETPAIVENGNIDESTYLTYPKTISSDTKLYTIYDDGSLDFFLENVEALCTYAKDHESDQEVSYWNRKIIVDDTATSLYDYVASVCSQKDQTLPWSDFKTYQTLAINAYEQSMANNQESLQTNEDTETSESTEEETATSENIEPTETPLTDETNEDELHTSKLSLKNIIITIIFFIVSIYLAVQSKNQNTGGGA